jgi:hypothetical protein
MKYNLQPRKASRKDYSFHKSKKLGAVVLPDELLFLSPILSQDAEDCTAFSSVASRYNETNTEYDPLQFWQNELTFSGVSDAPDGFDVQTPAAVGVEVGFTNLPNLAVQQGKASAYFWVTSGNGNDLFDNIRLAIQSNQRPVTGGLLWYNEYNTSDGIMNDNGKTLLGGHCIKIAGWTTKNGVPYLVLQNSWGVGYGDQGKFYMPRVLVNKAFPPFGVFYWSDDPDAQIKELGLFASMLQNLINLYKTLIKQTTGYPPPVVSTNPTIIQWANAIAKAEGAKASINNPGDLKVSTLTKSWGATNGFQATDGGWIAAFSTYEQGFQALVNFLTLGKENQLLAFHQARTLAAFTKVFAGNPPQGYYNTIYTELGVGANFNVTNFI